MVFDLDGAAGLAGLALAAASPAPLRTAATVTAPMAAPNVLRIAASLGGGSRGAPAR
jgi:hypothetical protein